MSFFNTTEQDKNTNTLWVERYRPRVLEEYVGNDLIKEKVGNYIETNDVPHLLFFGKAGTGKTTLAKLIVNSLECDYIIINASDERGIDTIREKIKGFASTVGFKPLKVIILDEADYLTPEGQAALRNVMETFSKHTRFILTCNYVEKIISPIQSRTQTFQIVPPTKKDVAVQVSRILAKEGITFEPKDLVPIIDSSYPDIRKIINTCQLNSSKGTLKLDITTIVGSDVKSKILDILKTDDVYRNKYMNIRQVVADYKIHDFVEIYTFLFEKVDEYAEDPTGVILKLAEGSFRDSLVVDKEITFMATILEILRFVCKK